MYVLGNPFLEGDSLPLRLVPRLKKALPELEFIPWDPTEEFPEENPLCVVDTILNTARVVVWDDIDAIRGSPRYSVHDFDLGMTLKVLKKMGKIHAVKIFGVPPHGDEAAILHELVSLMTSSLLGNASHN